MNFMDSLKSMIGLFAPVQMPNQPDINPIPVGLGNNSVNSRAFDSPPDISQVNIGPQDPYDRLRQLFTPDHKYIDQADQMLSQFPTRPKQSTGQKIAGSLYGLAHSPKEVEDLMSGPYNRQLQDWKMRFDPLMALANQERYGNAQESQFARSVLTDQLNRDKLDEVIRNNTVKANQSQQKINIAKQRANTYEEINKWRTDHANYERYIQPNGDVWLIDKNSGDTLDTGIPSNVYDEKQLIKLRGSIQSGLESQRQRNRVSLEETRQANREKLVTARAAARKAAVTKDKQMSVSQDAAAWKLARQQYIADNPSHAIFWDSLTGLPTNDAEDDDTGTYETAMTDIRNRYNSIKARAHSGPVTTPPGPVKGKVLVISPQGTKGYWDLNKGPIPKGYKETK